MRAPDKIISGGQTGVDRAALDFAKERGIVRGGWAPRGWKAEDGAIPEEHRPFMTECTSDSYPLRTRLNVKDGDATLIVSWRYLLDARGKFTGGTLATARFAQAEGRRLAWVYLDDEWPGVSLKVRHFVDNLATVGPVTLNIAGPRESKAPGTYEATLKMLREVWP